MRISDWSSDVCSSDLHLLFPGAEPLISPCPSHLQVHHVTIGFNQAIAHFIHRAERQVGLLHRHHHLWQLGTWLTAGETFAERHRGFHVAIDIIDRSAQRSEEHTSELQSLMRISYAVFCLKKNN